MKKIIKNEFLKWIEKKQRETKILIKDDLGCGILMNRVLIGRYETLKAVKKEFKKWHSS